MQAWEHCKELCIYCSQQITQLTQDFSEGTHFYYFYFEGIIIGLINLDPVKAEILKISERLANPVLSKQFKNQLLRLKQKDPRMFRDVCVYSEVCRMFSECSYTLFTRRILHELFLDVVYDKCFETPRKMLGLENKPRETGRKSTGDIAVSPMEFKTLDSLRLISTENKFPIRTRKNTN